MTKYLENPEGVFNRWYGERLPDGTLVNPTDVDRWTDEERAARGLYEVDDSPTPPPDSVLLIGEVRRVGEEVVFYTEYGEIPWEQIRDDKLQRSRALRKEKEEAGIVFAGAPIQTDDKTQAKITGASSLFDNDPTLTSVDWEAQPGIWIAVDKPTVKALGVAVGRYVQGCFSRSRALAEALNAASGRAEVDAIDVESGWPDRVIPTGE